MQAHDEPALGWTLVLRRQPVRLVAGRPEGGYTDAYELICCDCGDDEYEDPDTGWPAGTDAPVLRTGVTTTLNLELFVLDLLPIENRRPRPISCPGGLGPCRSLTQRRVCGG